MANGERDTKQKLLKFPLIKSNHQVIFCHVPKIYLFELAVHYIMLYRRQKRSE